ncbi:hypothetical protein MMC26_007204 [Xylographa opegraphella]|nr:hypothetical protein [Xylographa opegraphella]
MAPPPATPSPHRFVPQSRGRADPKPQSSLRNRYSLLSSASAQQQFAPTPKFSARPSASHEDVAASTASSPLVSRARPAWKGQQREEIEETAEWDGEEDGDEDPRREVSGDEDVAELELPGQAQQSLGPHKRRRSSPLAADRDAIRISDDDDEGDPGALSPTSGSSSPLGSPTTTHLPLPPSAAAHGIPASTATTPRFHLAPPPSTPTPLSLPRFIIPTPALTEPPAPLPEAFSPHRRGAKYLPSGLAATCRDWVLSASQLGTRMRKIESGDDGEAELAARVRVQEVRHGQGMVLVRSGKGERWMLIGGHRTGAGLREGEVVGVKRPVWEVEVDGETWGVGVEWALLGEARES